MVAQRRALRYARPRNPSEIAQIANTARLVRTTDWSDLTSGANSSPNHVKNMDRWRQAVLAENPDLSDAQVDILAERMRTQYYRDLSRKSHEARAAAKTAGL